MSDTTATGRNLFDWALWENKDITPLEEEALQILHKNTLKTSWQREFIGSLLNAFEAGEQSSLSAKQRRKLWEVIIQNRICFQGDGWRCVIRQVALCCEAEIKYHAHQKRQE